LPEALRFFASSLRFRPFYQHHRISLYRSYSPHFRKILLKREGF
jgi:hypothetical protein